MSKRWTSPEDLQNILQKEVDQCYKIKLLKLEVGRLNSAASRSTSALPLIKLACRYNFGQFGFVTDKDIVDNLKEAVRSILELFAYEIGGREFLVYISPTVDVCGSVVRVRAWLCYWTEKLFSCSVEEGGRIPDIMDFYGEVTDGNETRNPVTRNTRRQI